MSSYLDTSVYVNYLETKLFQNRLTKLEDNLRNLVQETHPELHGTRVSYNDLVITIGWEGSFPSEIDITDLPEVLHNLVDRKYQLHKQMEKTKQIIRTMVNYFDGTDALISFSWEFEPWKNAQDIWIEERIELNQEILSNYKREHSEDYNYLMAMKTLAGME